MSLEPSKETLRWLHERPYRESPDLRRVEALEETRLAVRIRRAWSGSEPLASTELSGLIGVLKARNPGAWDAVRNSGQDVPKATKVRSKAVSRHERHVGQYRPRCGVCNP